MKTQRKNGRPKPKTLGSINSYLGWLMGLVKRPGPSYTYLFELIFSQEFYEIVPNDYNRLENAKSLRVRYGGDHFLEKDGVAVPPVSLLEVMITLAYHLNDITYDPETPDQQGVWFWFLVRNLGLDEFYDGNITDSDKEFIQETLSVVVERTYESSGVGGLFPLSYPERDQTEVELWYQMMDWLEGYNFD